MATGILGQSNPAANTNTTVYTVPAGLTATFNINVVNTGATPLAIRIAISATGTPTTGEYIEYDTIIPGSGVLERGGFVAQATKNIVVYSSTTTSTVSVYGYEA